MYVLLAGYHCIMVVTHAEESFTRNFQNTISVWFDNLHSGLSSESSEESSTLRLFFIVVNQDL